MAGGETDVFLDQGATANAGAVGDDASLMWELSQSGSSTADDGGGKDNPLVRFEQRLVSVGARQSTTSHCHQGQLFDRFSFLSLLDSPGSEMHPFLLKYHGPWFSNG